MCARGQAPLFAQLGFQVISLWGHTLQKAQSVAAEQGVPFSTDKVDRMILHGAVDLIVISTPPQTHAEIAVKAVSAGKHVICTNPMALNVSQASKMLSTAAYYPKLLNVLDGGLRFLPAFQHLRMALASGAYGPLMAVQVDVQTGSLLSEHYSWKCDETLGGGALGAIGSHIVDAVYFVTGLCASEVTGQMRTYVPTTPTIRGFRCVTADDFCTMTLKLGSNTPCHSDGVLACVTINTHAFDAYRHEFVVTCARGRLILRNAQLFLQHRSGQCERVVPDTTAPSPSPSALDGPQAMCGAPDAGDGESPLDAGTRCMMQALARAHEEGNMAELNEVAATFRDGLYVQAVIDAVRKSSRTGQWVRIDRKALESHTHRSPFWARSALDQHDAEASC